MYLLWWLCIYSGGQTRRNEILTSKLNKLHWRSRSINLQNNRDLSKVLCTSGPNLVILAWTGDKLSCGQVHDWHMDGRTDTHRQTQAMIIPGGQNWPRMKNTELLYFNLWIIYKSFNVCKIHFCLKFQRELLHITLFNIHRQAYVISVSANVLAPMGARPSATTKLTLL